MIRPFVPSDGTTFESHAADARIAENAGIDYSIRGQTSASQLHGHRSISVEVFPPNTPQMIPQSPDIKLRMTSSRGLSSARDSGSRSSARTARSAISESRLSTTDLLKANEILRRENERLRLRILRASRDAATSSTTASASSPSGMPSSRGNQHTPSRPTTRVVRFTDIRPPKSAGAQLSTPPLPPPPSAPIINAHRPPTQPAAAPPPPIVPGPSPFAGFFRHFARPPRAGATNLPELRFREWVGNSGSLF